jgi:hypothetical protein
MTHEQLCERARRWLAGTRRCEPVYSNVASCSEIPDAIGWSSCHKWAGSTVIECKTSVADFHNERRKYKLYKHPTEDWTCSAKRISRKEAEQYGYAEVSIPNMGDYRYIMCPVGLLTSELIKKYTPDHGLLWVDGRVVWQLIGAPRREAVNKDAEIRFLRFAIINGKSKFDEEVQMSDEYRKLEENDFQVGQ